MESTIIAQSLKMWYSTKYYIIKFFVEEGIRMRNALLTWLLIVTPSAASAGPSPITSYIIVQPWTVCTTAGDACANGGYFPNYMKTVMRNYGVDVVFRSAKKIMVDDYYNVNTKSDRYSLFGKVEFKDVVDMYLVNSINPHIDDPTSKGTLFGQAALGKGSLMINTSATKPGKKGGVGRLDTGLHETLHSLSLLHSDATSPVQVIAAGCNKVGGACVKYRQTPAGILTPLQLSKILSSAEEKTLPTLTPFLKSVEYDPDGPGEDYVYNIELGSSFGTADEGGMVDQYVKQLTLVLNPDLASRNDNLVAGVTLHGVGLAGSFKVKGVGGGSNTIVFDFSDNTFGLGDRAYFSTYLIDNEEDDAVFSGSMFVTLQDGYVLPKYAFDEYGVTLTGDYGSYNESLSSLVMNENFDTSRWTFSDPDPEVLTSVPEPSLWLLYISGFGLIGLRQRLQCRYITN